MYKTVDKLYGNQNYMRYENSVKHLDNGQTVCELVQHFDKNKAMKNSEFADNYNKYYNTIKKLEIARRRGKSK